MSQRYDYYDWYEPSRPKEVKGGIKAQSKRGSFSQKWWGKLWISTLESFDIGARLSRGRSYARLGQVASLDIKKGCVYAEVQGSRQEAYRICIKLKTLTEEQWRKVIERILEKPIFAAQLLGNEMPQEIESVFKKAGLSLFPQKKEDLETDCSCPDWSNPCKHIAAVFYLMAEAFDKDPFLLFKMRGMERNEFSGSLQQAGATVDKDGSEIVAAALKIKHEPLPTDPGLFWGQCSATVLGASGVTPVGLHAALPKRLGSLAFWRSNKNFIDEMEKIYRNASGYVSNGDH